MIRRTPLAGLWLVSLLAGTASACGQTDTENHTPQSNGIIVQCASEFTPTQCDQALARHHVEVVKSLGRPGLFLVTPPKDKSVTELVDALRSDPALKYAEPNRRVGR